MTKPVPGLVAGAALALGTTVLQPAAAEPGAGNPGKREEAQAHRPDNLPGPPTDKSNRKKAKAMAMLANGSAEPDRSRDNSTLWRSDFSKAYYDDLFNGDGESFKDHYSKLSSGRYTAVNTVSDWVQVPGNASLYGDGDFNEADGYLDQFQAVHAGEGDPEAYWTGTNPHESVKVAGVGVTASVVAETGNVLTVEVHNPVP